MARITSLRYGADGYTHYAELLTASASCVRPVIKLAPFSRGVRMLHICSILFYSMTSSTQAAKQ